MTYDVFSKTLSKFTTFNNYTLFTVYNTKTLDGNYKVIGIFKNFFIFDIDKNEHLNLSSFLPKEMQDSDIKIEDAINDTITVATKHGKKMIDKFSKMLEKTDVKMENIE